MTLYPNVCALQLAGLIADALAASVLKLYKAIAHPLSVTTVLADFTECDFSGYTVETITAWLAPYLDPAGGASFQSGTKQFNFDGTDLTPTINTVFGWYVVNGTDLEASGTFDAPIAMDRAGASIPLNVILNMFRS